MLLLNGARSTYAGTDLHGAGGRTYELPTWCPNLAASRDAQLGRPGMFVRYVEDFSFADFAEDPVKAIRNHASDLSIAEAIIGITDVAKESMIAKECLKHP